MMEGEGDKERRTATLLYKLQRWCAWPTLVVEMKKCKVSCYMYREIERIRNDVDAVVNMPDAVVKSKLLRKKRETRTDVMDET
jgi:hypothetical protein